MYLVKIYVDIVTAAILRVIHFPHSPVSPLTGNSEIEFAVSYHRPSLIDMADACDDLALEFQMQGVNDSNVTIQLQVIIGGCRFLSTRALQTSIRIPF